MKNKIASNSFILYSSIYLLLLFFGRKDIACYLTPGINLFLIFIVATFQDFPTKKFLFLALFFSWIGDIILIFEEYSKLTFIIGLTLFLVTHIFYIILFNKQSKTEKFKFGSIFLIGIGVITIHLITTLYLILPNLGDLKAPIFLYTLTLSTMVLFAFKGTLEWQNQQNMNVLFGAFSLVVSDSIYAFNIFYAEIPNATFWQESSYLIAQFLITTGILSLNKQKTASSAKEKAV